MSKSQTVFLVGATGNTGASIVEGLLEDGRYHVIAAVRPASASKPEVEALKARGVEIRIVDLESESVEQLRDHIKGADVVIAALAVKQFGLQTALIKASKEAGVKRFIPCDWATAAVRGIRDNYDEKAKYHDLIKEIGLPYTFIDVGWWYQIGLPIIDPAKEPSPGTAELSRTIYGTGNVKSALTDVRDIGKFVARIISDERTLNRYVFCWAEHHTQNEIFALAGRIVGKPIPTKHMAPENILPLAEVQEPGTLKRTLLQYFNSLYVRGDNTVENAKKEEYGGALDARELYPDIELRYLEDYAKEYYSK